MLHLTTCDSQSPKLQGNGRGKGQVMQESVGGMSSSSCALGSSPQLLSHQTQSSKILPSPRHSSAEKNLSLVPHCQENKVQTSRIGRKDPSKPASNPPSWLFSTTIPHDTPRPCHFSPAFSAHLTPKAIGKPCPLPCPCIIVT